MREVVDPVLQLDLGEGAALARLDVRGLDRDPQAPVVGDHIAGLDGVAVDLHGVCLSFWADVEGLNRARKLATAPSDSKVRR